jgi:hypothetical protein
MADFDDGSTVAAVASTIAIASGQSTFTESIEEEEQRPRTKDGTETWPKVLFTWTTA